MLWGKDKLRDALERLDQLTKDEGLSVVAQTLGVVHDISKAVMGGAPYFCKFLTDICLNLPVSLDGKAPTGGIGQNSDMGLSMKRLLFLSSPFIAEADGIL